MTAVDAGPGRVVGVVLAAGAGTRMGRPKALVRRPDGRPWVDLAATALLDGGCDAVVVVLGAASREARALVPDRPAVRSVVADDWERGPSASLLTGLTAAAEDPDVTAALVTLVDLPGLPHAAVRRVLDDGGRTAPDRGSLRRAVHDGRPGHPVLLGRDHWRALGASLRASLRAALDPGTVVDADRGAGPWLRSAGAQPVECGDLWDGADQDRPLSGRAPSCRARSGAA
ncbi:NTP transferase domain-containing protein [Curtobacterium sp. MCLR17_032]|uniref:nucleotidyltransferase family protein n=1 Tax=Curtobacterium sp. MCLR17_032 TaxID=2175650 RepID=UPI000DA99564|nr:NTP transferase domain-containing protein [Curtobacterium sp. MCLR17_032]WIE60660.1 NTP transferase domain-containing protein [Curtobacterium sp. MCLR17_032]